MPKPPSFYRIKFSRRFYKLRPFDVDRPFRLLDVILVNSSNLSKEFLAYDTAYDGGYYPIQPSKYLLLLLEQDGRLLTTLRRYTSRKESFYRSLIGGKVGVKITRP